MNYDGWNGDENIISVKMTTKSVFYRNRNVESRKWKRQKRWRTKQTSVRWRKMSTHCRRQNHTKIVDICSERTITVIMLTLIINYARLTLLFAFWWVSSSEMNWLAGRFRRPVCRFDACVTDFAFHPEVKLHLSGLFWRRLTDYTESSSSHE